MTPLVYSVPEVARLLGCAPETVRKAIRLGQIRGVRLADKRLVIPREALDEYLNSKGVAS